MPPGRDIRPLPDSQSGGTLGDLIDTVIWDSEDTYVVADSGDGWRILGDIVHDE